MAKTEKTTSSDVVTVAAANTVVTSIARPTRAIPCRPMNPTTSPANAARPAANGPLIAADALTHLLDDPAHDVVLADVRWYLDERSGRDAYQRGHIAGAVFVDLDADLSTRSDDPTAGRHPFPTPLAFADAMGRRGISDGTTVVAYDDSGGGTAGRLVWMLRILGHDARLLDGGLGAWQQPLEYGLGPDPAPRPFTETPWPSGRLAGPEDVVSDGPMVLDARSADRYRGEVEPIDARPGHIPGALNAPWAEFLDRPGGRFLSTGELHKRFTALGIDESSDVIAYCGSGVSACADLLALEVAGYRNARLFVPSWSGWSADPDRPAAVVVL